MARKVIPGGFGARRIGDRTPEQLRELSRQFDADVDAIRRAVLRQLGNGTDIGELIYYAFTKAQKQVAEGFNLLDNRPGSWESASLDTMMENVILGIKSEQGES